VFPTVTTPHRRRQPSAALRRRTRCPLVSRERSSGHYPCVVSAATVPIDPASVYSRRHNNKNNGEAAMSSVMDSDDAFPLASRRNPYSVLETSSLVYPKERSLGAITL